MEPIGRIPTGIAPFDLYTGGGIPEGTTSLLTGVEGSGKSTTAIRAIAGFQKMYPDKSVFYVNAENKLDPQWIKTHGGNPQKVAVFFPSTTEEAQYLIREVATQRDDVGLVIVDSLAALCPERESEAEPNEEQMGIAARLNNKFMRQLTSIQLSLFQKKRSLTVILINQERESLKLYGGTVIPGGKGQRFHAALWCKFLKSENKVDMKLQVPISTTIRFVLIKNIGNPSQWPGQADMCITPHSKWKPGQFMDHEFVWLWGTQRLPLLRNRGTKGYEYQSLFLPKKDWIAKWEDDPVAYAQAKQDLHILFQKWINGEIKENFIEPDDYTEVQQEGEMGEG